MEIQAAKKHKFIVFAYEFLGTALLLYAINLQKGFDFGCFGIAFTIFICLLIGAPITGAHYNPAVTLGVYICDADWREDVDMFLVMMAAQFLGAFFGVGMVWLSLYNSSVDALPTWANVPVSEINYLLPNAPYVTVWNAFQIEMICTFVFVMCNLIVKTKKTSPTDQGFLGCFAVAITLLAMICVSGSKTGACLNPAVGLAQTVY